MQETFDRTVREAMHEGCECIRENQSALEAAKRMEQLDIGAMPICGQRHRLPHLVGDAQTAVVSGRCR